MPFWAAFWGLFHYLVFQFIKKLGEKCGQVRAFPTEPRSGDSRKLSRL